MLVRVKACAICHSDVAYIDGAWGGVLPAVYGHEAAGVVEEVGAGAEDALSAGDDVVVTLVRACGRCERCRQGRPTLCEGLPPPVDDVIESGSGSPIHQGMRTAAFAELVLVDASQVVAVPKSVPPEVACLLACGVLTGVGAATNAAAVEAGATVAVLGVGGVGINCVQGAALAGAGRIVAVDLVAEKLEVARRFGATDVVDASLQEVAEAVRDITGGRGADYVFVAAGVPRLVETGCDLLRRGGTLVLVGIPPSGSTVTLDPVAIADGSLRLIGTKMGSSRPHEDIPRLADLYKSGKLKLDELVSRRYGFDEIDDAVSDTRAAAHLRSVVVF